MNNDLNKWLDDHSIGLEPHEQEELCDIFIKATDEAYQRGYNTGWVRRNRAEPFPQTAPAKMQVDKSKLKAKP